MATTVRKQAPRLARPAGRYWKGKAPKGAADLPSDESDEEKEEVPQEEGDVAFAGEQEFSRAEYDDEEEEEAEEEKGNRGRRTGKMSVALKNVNISKEGKVIVAGRQEVDRTEVEGMFCNLIIINDYENYLEISEETGEESDAKASSRDETDDVCQPPSYICSLNGYLVKRIRIRIGRGKT
jgi:microfibrillar-associated protein 1